MIASRISLEQYEEDKTILPGDRDMEHDVYQMKIHNMEVFVVLGTKQTFKTHCIFPIYLVRNNDAVIRIGLYELKKCVTNIVLIGQTYIPLLFRFATKKFVSTHRKIPEKSCNEKKEVNREVNREKKKKEKEENKVEKAEEKNKVEKAEKAEKAEEKPIPDIRADIFTLQEGVQPISIPIPEENASVKQEFDKSQASNWLDTFMQSNHYTIADNEGGGDCFFCTIRDAFATIGQKTTIQMLREKLTTDPNISLVYNNYKTLYDASEKTQTELQAKLKEATDSITKNKLSEEMKINAELHQDYQFIKKIKNLEQFKTYIKKSAFWADLWAIHSLEQLLNIKFILLSSENYKNKNFDNVLQCGEKQDTETFQPEYYIMIEHTGNHYKLIGYKNKFLFTYPEIPYDMKMLIYEKCMQGIEGSFENIPDFQHFKKTIGKVANKKVAKTTTKKEKVEKVEKAKKVKKTKDAKEKVEKGIGGGSTKNDEFEDMDKEILEESYVSQGLYDPNIVFVCFSKSVNKLPGKCAGEKIKNSQLSEFRELASIPEWRQKLTDFWCQPFELDDKKWMSVEHFKQASKFKKDNPHFYEQFSLSSNTQLSKDPSLAKGMGSYDGTYQGILIRDKDIYIDSSYNEQQYKVNLKRALQAKFTQNKDLQKLLMHTKHAKLTQFMRLEPPQTMVELMELRKQM